MRQCSSPLARQPLRQAAFCACGAFGFLSRRKQPDFSSPPGTVVIFLARAPSWASWQARAPLRRERWARSGWSLRASARRSHPTASRQASRSGRHESARKMA
eukprot:6196251-Pleurochrysis_carterae.AAC.1